ncbi:MAG: LptF/LptG family permease [Candidatus Eisenbacteria bacterium]
MSILSRYVLRAHLAPAAAGLAIFYFVLSMDFIVDYLDLFIAKGVPGFAVLEAFGLSLAWMTLLAVPMSVMVSVLTAFGRLSGDNEITAARATGVGVFSLIAPVLLASLIVAAGVFFFGDRFLPTANHRLKALMVDIHRIRPLATVEPGIMVKLPEGYRIIVGGLDSATSEIFDVRIHRMEGDDPLQTIVAKRGTIATSGDDQTIRIQLLDGEIHELDPDDPTRYSRLLFEKHTINVEQGTTELVRTDRAKRGDREMSVSELREQIVANRADAAESLGRAAALLSAPAESPDADPSADGTKASRDAESETRKAQSALRKATKLEVEYHKKFSIPFSCVIFVLLGAPLGIRSRRGGVGIGAGIGILFFLIYYLFLIGGEQLGDRGLVSPFWSMWAPNVLFGGVGLFLTMSASFDWRTSPLTRAIDFALRAPRGPAPTEPSQ